MFTIITTTFNCGSDLVATISSIKEQTYKNLQWIVLDGASTDGTLDLLQANIDLIGHFRSRFDDGIYASWNEAIPHIENKWVIFMGAGDTFFSKHTLSNIAPHLTNLEEAMLVYGKTTIVDKNSNELQRQGQVDLKKWNQGLPQLPCTNSIMHNKQIFTDGLIFDDNYKVFADAKLLLQTMASSEPVFLDIDIGKMLNGGISTSPRGWLLTLQETTRIREELGLVLPPSQWAPFETAS